MTETFPGVNIQHKESENYFAEIKDNFKSLLKSDLESLPISLQGKEPKSHYKGKSYVLQCEGEEKMVMVNFVKDELKNVVVFDKSHLFNTSHSYNQAYFARAEVFNCDGQIIDYRSNVFLKIKRKKEGENKRELFATVAISDNLQKNSRDKAVMPRGEKIPYDRQYKETLLRLSRDIVENKSEWETVNFIKIPSLF